MSSLIEVVEFGPYEPDSPDLYNPGLEGAVNVIPRGTFYEPLPSMTPISNSVLPSRPLGSFGCFDQSGNSYIFAGIDGFLYQFRSAAWVDSSRTSPAYVAGDDRWEFAKWGNICIAAGLKNDLQYITLGGNNFQDLTTNLKAHHVAVIRDFVMVGDVEDQDGINPNRIRWCAFRNPFDWIPSPSTQADFRDIEGQSKEGFINRIIGGEYGLVFFSDSIYRVTLTGPPEIFQIDEIDPNVGTISESSIVQHAGKTYFLSEDGFRVTRGGISESIGQDKINRDVLSLMDYNHLDRIRVSVFKDQQVIIWAIPTSGNIGGRPNRLIIYNFVQNRWAAGVVEVEDLFLGATTFTSFDDPIVDDTYGNLDGIPGSSDDKIWAGGTTEFMGIDELFRLNSWNGAPYESILTTGEKNFNPGRRTSVNEIRPIVGEGQGVQVAVGFRDRQTDPVSWTLERPENESGIIPHYVDARYIRFRARIPEGVTFDDTVGLAVYGQPSGG